VPHRNSTLLHQPGHHLLGAIFTQFRVHRRTASRIGIADHLDYVSTQSLRRLRQLIELRSFLFLDVASADWEVNRSFAFDVEVIQSLKAPGVFLDRAQVLLNLLFIGADLLLIG